MRMTNGRLSFTNGGNQMNVPDPVMNIPVTAPVYAHGYNQMNIPVTAPAHGYNQMNIPVAAPFYNQMNIPVAAPFYIQMNIPVPVPEHVYFRGKSVPVYNVCNNKCFTDNFNEAKMHLNNHPEIQLSALEMAIPDAIRIAEILEETRFASKKEILTYKVHSTNLRDRGLDKAKIKIRLRRMRQRQILQQ